MAHVPLRERTRVGRHRVVEYPGPVFALGKTSESLVERPADMAQLSVEFRR
jgi:hypothetical protein